MQVWSYFLAQSLLLAPPLPIGCHHLGLALLSLSSFNSYLSRLFQPRYVLSVSILHPSLSTPCSDVRRDPHSLFFCLDKFPSPALTYLSWPRSNVASCVSSSSSLRQLVTPSMLPPHSGCTSKAIPTVPCHNLPVHVYVFSMSFWALIGRNHTLSIWIRLWPKEFMSTLEYC